MKAISTMSLPKHIRIRLILALKKSGITLAATCCLLMMSSLASAQLTGSKTIPGNYASVALAVTDLNTQGVGAGGVTFTVADGYTETAPAEAAEPSPTSPPMRAQAVVTCTTLGRSQRFFNAPHQH